MNRFLPNACAAALRHLSRNRLQACVAIGGLAIGLCTALIAGLVILNQYTFDHDVPAYARTYVLVSRFEPPGLAPQYVPLSIPDMADQLRSRFPGIEAASRAFDVPHRLRYGDRESRETVYWADPNFFDLLPAVPVAGDPTGALQSADGVVLTRAAARRLFGRDAPLGASLLVEDQPMTVRAVIEDSPPNTTHVSREIIASGLSAYSAFNAANAPNRGQISRFRIAPGFIYVRLKPGAEFEPIARAMPELTRPDDGGPQMFIQELVRIDRFHTHEGLNPGFADRMAVLALLGIVVLLVAAINFVNLQTARSLERSKEVAIRSLAGASRARLIGQLLAEALVHSMVATLLTLMLAEWLLPQVNAFLDTGARLDYFHQPALAGAVAVCLLLGLLAGVWPAIATARLRPLLVLRGASTTVAGRGRGRQVLVTLQFATLVALGICAGVVHRQRDFAIHDALRMDRDQVLLISVSHTQALVDRMRAMPGVRAVTRAGTTFLGSVGFRGIRGISIGTTQTATGKQLSVNTLGVDFDLFDFYGVAPLAGTLPKADGTPLPRNQDFVVLNETAVRKFELGTPKEAIGKSVATGAPGRPNTIENGSTVLAVVPDLSLSPVQENVPPTAYYQLGPQDGDLINVRLSGHDVPETLAAIDAAWLDLDDNRKLGMHGPVRFFLDEHVQHHYVSVLRQSQAFGICALIAIALGCVGLYALTAASAARRTREIGLRKALGAQTTAIARLLLWQFTRPVVWGVLIAWPVAAGLMHRWLEGFAYHADLPLWLFPAAAFAALLIAAATVTAHTVLVARTPPATALRCE